MKIHKILPSLKLMWNIRISKVLLESLSVIILVSLLAFIHVVDAKAQKEFKEDVLGTLEGDQAGRAAYECSECYKNFKDDQCSINENCAEAVDRAGQLLNGQSGKSHSGKGHSGETSQ